jgi:murein DD-endopeptidase MepM/ murein hydrolase activator NlpD
MDWIKQRLKEAGIKQTDLLEEMVDHFYTVYEEAFSMHQSKDIATNLVLNQISHLNAKKLNQDIFIIHHKLKIIIAMITALIVSFFLSFNISQDPPSEWPVISKHVTSDFGMRLHPISKEKKLHKGIDIKAAIGDEIFAPAAGTVIESNISKGNGHYIVIKHDEEYTTRYHHLSVRNVKKGDKVKKKQLIGEVGNSGISVRPHLHYEVIKNGEHVDPREFLKV